MACAYLFSVDFHNESKIGIIPNYILIHSNNSYLCISISTKNEPDMSLELLKELIKSACLDGIISEEEEKFLRKRAKEFGIPQADLNFMIKSELDLVISQQNASKSSFTKVSDKDEKKSGFTKKPSENIKPTTAASSESDKFLNTKNLNYQGAMSLVQKAKLNSPDDSRHNQWVIVKRLKPQHRDDDAYQTLLFNKEFEILRQLEHPNICQVLGRGKDKHGVFYYMKYEDGRPMSDLIEENGIPSGAVVKKTALEVLRALEYIHKKQIVHRDIKPENIIVTYINDNVKLIDFGLAAADQFEDFIIKAGTPKYAAPEQKNSDTQIDQRADIYAFGMLFLEMLTGQTTDKPAAMKRSQAAKQIIEKATLKNPEERYNNCGEIINELQNIDIDDNQLNIELSASKIDFGKVPLREKRTETITILNAKEFDRAKWHITQKPHWLDVETVANQIIINFDASNEIGRFYDSFEISGNGSKATISVHAGIVKQKTRKMKNRRIITILLIIVAIIAAILFSIHCGLFQVDDNEPTISYYNKNIEQAYIFTNKITDSLADFRVIAIDVKHCKPSSQKQNYLTCRFNLISEKDVILKNALLQIDTINNKARLIRPENYKPKYDSVLSKMKECNVTESPINKLVFSFNNEKWTFK